MKAISLLAVYRKRRDAGGCAVIVVWSYYCVLVMYLYMPMELSGRDSRLYSCLACLLFNGALSMIGSVG